MEIQASVIDKVENHDDNVGFTGPLTASTGMLHALTKCVKAVVDCTLFSNHALVQRQ